MQIDGALVEIEHAAARALDEDRYTCQHRHQGSIHDVPGKTLNIEGETTQKASSREVVEEEEREEEDSRSWEEGDDGTADGAKYVLGKFYFER
jgi:hypothetical protein